jgi:hypothetical protein
MRLTVNNPRGAAAANAFQHKERKSVNADGAELQQVYLDARWVRRVVERVVWDYTTK